MPRKKRNTSELEDSATAGVPQHDADLAEAGQSGDLQGLSGIAMADSESVRELVAEGQFFEAAVIAGVENAPDADVSEVRTREVPEDDVPAEYRETDLDEPKE